MERCSVAKAWGKWPHELDELTPEQAAKVVGFERAIRDIRDREKEIAANRAAAGVPQQ